MTRSGIEGECASDAEALALAAGELVREAAHGVGGLEADAWRCSEATRSSVSLRHPWRDRWTRIGSAMAEPTRHGAGRALPNGSWKIDLDVAADLAQRGLVGGCGRRLALEAGSLAGGGLDQAEDRALPVCTTCRSRSRRRAPGSRRGQRLNEMPSRPRGRCRSCRPSQAAFRTGKAGDEVVRPQAGGRPRVIEAGVLQVGPAFAAVEAGIDAAAGRPGSGARARRSVQRRGAEFGVVAVRRCGRGA